MSTTHPITGATVPVSASTLNPNVVATGPTPWGTVSTQTNLTAEKLTLTGANADVVINGVHLSETIKKINERLEILTVNPRLEQKWQELAELGRQYRECEARLLEFEKTLEILESDH